MEIDNIETIDAIYHAAQAIDASLITYLIIYRELVDFKSFDEIEVLLPEIYDLHLADKIWIDLGKFCAYVATNDVTVEEALARQAEI